MRAIIKAYQKGKLKGIEPVVVIADRAEAKGIEKAKRLGIKTLIINPREDNLLNILKTSNVGLVSQNGWLSLTPADVVKKYEGKIINQHPAPLDPGRGEDFGGKGMYGARAICARIAYCWLNESEFWTEATAHFVTEKYDEGDLIRVERMSIPKRHRFDDKELIRITYDTQKKLLPLEHKNVTESLKMFARGEVKGFRRGEALITRHNYPLLKKAKNLAIKLFPSG